MNPMTTADSFVLTASSLLLGATLLVLAYLSGKNAGRQALQVPKPPESIPWVFPDPLSMVEIGAAESRLEALPHMRRLNNGALLDFLTGATVVAGSHPRIPSPHRKLSWPGGEKEAILLARVSSLEQYVQVQEAIAASLALGHHSLSSESVSSTAGKELSCIPC